MELRKTFDTILEQFDKFWARHSAELFSDLIAYAGIRPGKCVLEIGTGTGQATDPLLTTGCNYLSIEHGQMFRYTNILFLAKKPLV